MCAIELVVDRETKEPLGADSMNAIARRCLEEGVLVLTAGTYGNVVRLLPPLTIDDALLDEGLEVLDGAIGGYRLTPAVACQRAVMKAPEPARARRVRAAARAVALDLTPLRASRDFRLLWTGQFVSELATSSPEWRSTCRCSS